MSIHQLNQIKDEQLTLVEELDSRQDDIIRQLDQLSERIEHIISLYIQQRAADEPQERKVA